jgi:hypothetical protein
MNENELSIPFKIVKVEEKQFSVFEEALAIEAPIKQNIGFGFGVEFSKRMIGVTVRFVLQKNEQPLLKTEITCYFEVEQNAFAEKLSKEGSIILPSGFVKHLAMITTGTARGVLFANTKGTDFNKYILGLVNVNKMFKEDIVLKN